MIRQVFLISLFLFQSPGFAQLHISKQLNSYPAAQQVRSDFKKMLKRAATNPRPSFKTVEKDSVIIDQGFIYTEETEKVPVLIYKPVKPGSPSFPVVICLHGTGGSKEDDTIKELLFQLSKAGFMSVAIDARYHGERIEGGANKSQQYVEAIIKAWQNTNKSRQAHPFLYDTVYDLWKLTDYLISRPDVQSNRIGMMGVSMGGIETWIAASVDTRIKVAVPVIAAQSFNWSLNNNMWHGRAQTIWKVHQQAALDLGDTAVTKENVKQVWSKLIPGITGEFDCPSMLRLFAPRPLLLLSNEKDQNCPLEGARIAFKEVRNAYRKKNAIKKLHIDVTPDQPHRFLPAHMIKTIAWFKKWL
jgi:dienelactone hydrolase